MPRLVLAALTLSAVACAPEPHAYPAPDAHRALTGPGGPKVSFPADALWQDCAPLLGGEDDEQHHNLVVMRDGLLVLPWAPEDGGGGLSFYTFDDPCAPTLVGEVWADFMRESHTLAFGEVNGRTYLAVDYHESEDLGGVGFFDVTDPSDPKWVSQLALPDYHYPDAYFRVVLSTFWLGDTLYAAGGLNGVYVLDVSDPLNPALVGQHTVVGHMVGAVHVVGDVAMVSSAGLSRTILYDVSDPWTLSPIPGGDFYVSSADEELKDYYFASLAGKYGLFARKSDGGGPIIYDLSDPTAPTFVGEAPTEGGDGGYVMRHEGFLFQGDSDRGLVYDASDMSTPTILGEVDIAGDLDTVTPVGNVLVAAVDSKADDGRSSVVFPWAEAPDSRGPRLEWFRPKDGATLVPTTAALGLSFDEMIEGVTVFEGSLRVWTVDGEAVPGRLYTQENLVNFVPDVPWAEETTYVVELPAGGVADVSGNRVAETKRWTFTTGLELETPRW